MKLNFLSDSQSRLNDTTYNTGTYALKKKRAGGGIYLNMDNNQMLGVSAGDIAKLSEDTLDEMQVINKKTGKDVTKHMLAYMEGKITKEEFEELTGLSKEKIKVSESSAEYAKSLATIAKDKQLKMLSKKDKETLLKIADLMKRANEGTLDVSEEQMDVLKEKLVFYVDKKGKKRRFDTDATANKKYNKS